MTKLEEGLIPSEKRTKAKLEYRRRKIEEAIEQKICELAERFPDVDIGTTGTLSKSNPQFIDMHIMVDWRRE